MMKPKKKVMKKKTKKANGKKSAFGMLSVKAGIDNNPNPTQADRIAGAKKGAKQKMMGGGLYANIHAKRARGEKMRKKGAKGAPKAGAFARAKKTARS